MADPHMLSWSSSDFSQDCFGAGQPKGKEGTFGPVARSVEKVVRVMVKVTEAAARGAPEAGRVLYQGPYTLTLLNALSSLVEEILLSSLTLEENECGKNLPSMTELLNVQVGFSWT